MFNAPIALVQFTMIPIDFQLIQAKLSQNPHLILPTLILAVVLLKLFIFFAKLAFMPCGVNVKSKREKELVSNLLRISCTTLNL